MLAIHAKYRGRERRRAEIVQRSAEALSTLPGVGGFSVLGVEDIRAQMETPQAACDVAMALLADGNWAIGLAIAPRNVEDAATAIVGLRPGIVSVSAQDYASDIEAVFLLLAHLLSKRSQEGREATSLVRSGMSQVEAAEVLGISKQAMSQRLQAAGWVAENSGWRLANNLIRWSDGDR